MMLLSLLSKLILFMTIYRTPKFRLNLQTQIIWTLNSSIDVCAVDEFSQYVGLYDWMRRLDLQLSMSAPAILALVPKWIRTNLPWNVRNKYTLISNQSHL